MAPKVKANLEARALKGYNLALERRRAQSLSQLYTVEDEAANDVHRLTRLLQP